MSRTATETRIIDVRSVRLHFVEASVFWWLPQHERHGELFRGVEGELFRIGLGVGLRAVLVGNETLWDEVERLRA